MILLFIGGLFLIGRELIKIFFSKISHLEKIGLSFLMGTGGYTIWYFFLVSAHPVVPSNIWLNLIFLFLLLRLIALRSKASETVHTNYKNTVVSKILLGLISITFIYSFVIANYYPPFTPDALKIYDFRAHRLVESEGRLSSQFFLGNSQAYPPLTSLLHYFVYQTGYDNPQFLYPVILLAFVITIAGYMTRLSGNLNLGTLTGLMIMITPSVLWNSFLSITNIVFMSYFGLLVIYLIDPHQKKIRFGFILGLLSGIVSFIRAEPIWMSLVPIVILLTIARRQPWLPIFIWVTFVTINATWTNSNILAPRPKYQTAIEVRSAKDLTVESVRKPVEFVISPLIKSLGILLPLFVIASLYTIIKNKGRPNWIQLVAAVCTFSLIFGFVNLTSRYERWTDLGDSLFRYFVVLVPLFWISILSAHRPDIFCQRQRSIE